MVQTLVSAVVALCIASMASPNWSSPKPYAVSERHSRSA